MITHDDLRDLLRRMVQGDIYGRESLAMIGDMDLCAEMVTQGLARQHGPQLILTGNGWHTAREHWPKWVQEAIDLLVGQIVMTNGGIVKMDDVSRAAGFDLVQRHDAHRSEIVWAILAHCCTGPCFEQVTRTVLDDGRVEGTFKLAMKGYSLSTWKAAIDAPAWELLPIKEGTPP